MSEKITWDTPIRDVRTIFNDNDISALEKVGGIERLELQVETVGDFLKFTVVPDRHRLARQIGIPLNRLLEIRETLLKRAPDIKPLFEAMVDDLAKGTGDAMAKPIKEISWADSLEADSLEDERVPDGGIF